MPTTIFLEAHYFGEDSEELRLACDAVAATAGGLVIAGVETRHLRALKWRPDYLSYWDDGQLLRLAVGPWIALDALTVRFTLR
ncbi:hypothetical protein [Cupriavidus pinatubonensis]|uniref:Uncharacterized protein n=1 Tax=Cupriavidus pinatubonensis TaxID=248026 RepID=A0ABM8WDU5_9BURK|nr:hypothetical protein [Cupriavidus pinatubonensis]CAG9165460.1 hypothetical protein LMG23994_00705 [Cupriavidus pinatubonensis]